MLSLLIASKYLQNKTVSQVTQHSCEINDLLLRLIMQLLCFLLQLTKPPFGIDIYRIFGIFSLNTASRVNMEPFLSGVGAVLTMLNFALICCGVYEA